MSPIFKKVFICTLCETHFNEEPTKTCPICDEVEEISELSKSINTKEEFYRVQALVHKLEYPISKIDIYRVINEKWLEIIKKEKEV